MNSTLLLDIAMYKTIVFVGSLLLAATAAVDAAERPNIVLIFADDQGWQDAGYLGSDFIIR
jgi:hypothetical protein